MYDPKKKVPRGLAWGSSWVRPGDFWNATQPLDFNHSKHEATEYYDEPKPYVDLEA
jgi:hypothetical protein